MRDQASWAMSILGRGLVAMAAGLVVVVAVVALGLLSRHTGPGRLALSVGMLQLGLGIVRLLQYAYIRRHPWAGWRMMMWERDERLQLIRARAGQRAFVTSSALAITLLLWASLASDFRLPALSSDALWFSLVVVVVVPFLVYIGSVTYEQTFK